MTSNLSIGAKPSPAKRVSSCVPLGAQSTSISSVQSQLCLALSILKSKPADVNIREYCSQLRKHIRHGKPTLDGEYRYIDTVEFWKDQYSKLHAEKNVIEVRLCQLEMPSYQDRLDGKVTTIELGSLDNMVGHRSGKPSSDDGSANNLPLLKQALALHRLLQDDKVSTDILGAAIQSSLLYMSSAISVACEIQNNGKNEADGCPSQASVRTFDTVAAIFKICLKGLAHLCRDIPGRRCKGQIIFSLVQFFVKVLGHLNNICFRGTYKATGVSHYLDKAPHESDFDDASRALTLVRGLTKLLVHILKCPDFQTANLSNMEVLEGIYSALLEEVGGLLSYVIFGEQLSTSGEAATASRLVANASVSLDALAVDLKCRCLAYVLKGAIQGRFENDNQSLAAMLAGSKASGLSAGEKLVLARAKQRLQETLLKGIFGDDGEIFWKALQMPESEDGWNNEVPRAVRDEKQAFVELVWSTVGWELRLERNPVGY